MNLGLGLLAADEYFKEGDRRQVRDYQQKLRDADLSVLDDKTAATRSGYQDTAATNAARAQLRPGQTANAQARLGLDATNMEAEAERQPTENRTRAVNADMGLVKAENAQANLPQSLRLDNNKLEADVQTSEAMLKQLPAKLARAATQGVIDEQGQAEVVLGTMGKLISRQDKAGAINFANEIAKNTNLLPGTNGKTFADIRGVRKGDNGAPGDGYVFVTTDGDSRFVPIEKVSGAMQSMKSGKYKFIERDDGSIFAGDEGTGQGRVVQPGSPGFSKSGGGNTPASLQEAEWVIRNKDNPVAMAAWDKVRSLRGDGRQLFIKDMMTKGIMGNETQDQLKSKADMYGKLFDEMLRSNGGAPAAQPRASGNTWKSMLE